MKSSISASQLSTVLQELLKNAGVPIEERPDCFVVRAASPSGYDIAFYPEEPEVVVGYGPLWHHHTGDPSESIRLFFDAFSPVTRLTHRHTSGRLYSASVHYRDPQGAWRFFGRVGAFRLPWRRRTKQHLINSRLTTEEADHLCRLAHERLALPWELGGAAPSRAGA